MTGVQTCALPIWLFPDNNGFFTIFQINSEYFGSLSLDGNVLRLLYIWKNTRTKQGFDWVKIYSQHLDLLNSEWRRVEKKRLLKSLQEKYQEQLNSHVNRIIKYMCDYNYQEYEIKEIKELKDRLDDETIKYYDSEVDFLRISERILQELHVAILETLIPKIT